MKKPAKPRNGATTVRLPPELHDEIRDAAEMNGRSMNEEIIARLTTAPRSTTLDDICAQNQKTHEMVQSIIDAIGPRR